jgi:HSP20 family protein
MEMWRRIFELMDEAEKASWDMLEGCLEPLIELDDRGTDLVVTADLPCVSSKDDIQLNVTEESIEIRAAMHRQLKWERWGSAQSHGEFNSYRKSILLPSRVVPDKATAQFRKGVLTVRLPKVEKRVSIRID